MEEEFVKVGVRIRPPLKAEDCPSCLQIVHENPPLLHVVDKQQIYSCDTLFPKDSTQRQVYDGTVKPLVGFVKQGYNCTVFAYGQTGSGKTYTMGSDPHAYDDNPGIISRTLDDIFKDNGSLSGISVSFYEIYMEKVYDLLTSNKRRLEVKGGFNVIGHSQPVVTCAAQALVLLKQGSKNRQVTETNMNVNSSRSHAIFTIYYKNQVTEAKLNLVDLAGSENVRKTGCKGNSMDEGININIGLFTICRVIKGLSSNAPSIPYRETVITAILKDSLSKHNHIVLLACVSPNMEYMTETIQTLELVNNTKRVKNKPAINKIIQQFERDNLTTLLERSVPLKRSVSTKTKCATEVKKKRRNTFSSPNGAICSSMIDGSTKSLMSVNLSPVRKVQPTPIAITPIVERCTQAMQETLHRMFFDGKFTPGVENKENTPKVSLSMLQSLISTIQVQKPAIESEPLVINSDEKTFTARRMIDFDKAEVPNTSQKQNMFKMPDVPPQPKPRTLLLRRSTESAIDSDPNCSSVTAVAAIPCRRSVRLSLKLAKATEEPDKPSPCCSKPSPAPRKKVSKKPKGSPRTNHKQHVLHLLNEGSVKELQQLSMVGPKTARQIFLFRQLHGRFHAISDLKKIDSWKRGNLYKRFVESNFVSE